jgi:hypothetical protein
VVVVDRIARLKLVDEPEPALREGERRAATVAAGGDGARGLGGEPFAAQQLVEQSALGRRQVEIRL